MAKLPRLSVRFVWIFAITLVVVVLSVFFADRIIQSKTGELVFDSINDMPENKVGLLLGTSKYLSRGNMNLYYEYRIDAAEALFKSGKVAYILISGDNATRYYNEPITMKKDLISRGIPSDRIILDYAGFRTLDSVVRAREVFGQESITVISQRFHNERAIFIAQRKGIEAVGFNARDVGVNYGLKTAMREKLARVKVFFDLIFDVEPRFLGEPIQIG